MTTEKLERLGRFILWIALAGAILVSVGAALAQRRESLKLAAMAGEEAAKDKAQEAVAAEAATAAKFARLQVKSFGMIFQGFNFEDSSASLYFTNASPRAGYACVYAVASGAGPTRSARSLATCEQIQPFASNLRLRVSFTKADLLQACGNKGDCTIAFNDAE